MDWSADVRSPLVGLPEALITVYCGTCQATTVKRLSRLLGSDENLHQWGGRGAWKKEFFSLLKAKAWRRKMAVV